MPRSHFHAPLPLRDGPPNGFLANRLGDVGSLSVAASFADCQDAIRRWDKLTVTQFAIMEVDGERDNLRASDISDGWISRKGPGYRVVGLHSDGTWREVWVVGSMAKGSKPWCFLEDSPFHPAVMTGKIVEKGQPTPITHELGEAQVTAED